MCGRIGGAEIIDRVHDTAPEEIAPDPVYGSFGEVGMMHHPFGESLSGIFAAGGSDNRPVKQRGLQFRFGSRVEHFDAAVHIVIPHWLICRMVEYDVFIALVAHLEEASEEG